MSSNGSSSPSTRDTTSPVHFPRAESALTPGGVAFPDGYSWLSRSHSILTTSRTELPSLTSHPERRTRAKSAVTVGDVQPTGRTVSSSSSSSSSHLLPLDRRPSTAFTAQDPRLVSYARPQPSRHPSTSSSSHAQALASLRNGGSAHVRSYVHAYESYHPSTSNNRRRPSVPITAEELSVPLVTSRPRPKPNKPVLNRVRSWSTVSSPTSACNSLVTSPIPPVPPVPAHLATPPLLSGAASPVQPTPISPTTTTSTSTTDRPVPARLPLRVHHPPGPDESVTSMSSIETAESMTSSGSGIDAAQIGGGSGADSATTSVPSRESSPFLPCSHSHPDQEQDSLLRAHRQNESQLLTDQPASIPENHPSTLNVSSTKISSDGLEASSLPLPTETPKALTAALPPVDHEVPLVPWHTMAQPSDQQRKPVDPINAEIPMALMTRLPPPGPDDASLDQEGSVVIIPQRSSSLRSYSPSSFKVELESAQAIDSSFDRALQEPEPSSYDDDTTRDADRSIDERLHYVPGAWLFEENPHAHRGAADGSHLIIQPTNNVPTLNPLVASAVGTESLNVLAGLGFALVGAAVLQI